MYANIAEDDRFLSISIYKTNFIKMFDFQYDKNQIFRYHKTHNSLILSFQFSVVFQK